MITLSKKVFSSVKTVIIFPIKCLSFFVAFDRNMFEASDRRQDWYRRQGY